MFAKRAAGRHSRGFVHVLGAVAKSSFLNDFWVDFLTGGTPGASRAALDDQVGSQFDFLMVFISVPGVSFGVLVVPLGTLGPALGRPWASLWRRSWQRRLKKKASGAHFLPEPILRVNRDAPGHAE